VHYLTRYAEHLAVGQVIVERPDMRFSARKHPVIDVERVGRGVGKIHVTLANKDTVWVYDAYAIVTITGGSNGQEKG